MIGNGSPKEMIDKYKQILAGANNNIVETNENDVLEYGNNKATINDFYILDSN